MNKAFVKEQDQLGGQCPVCGGKGRSVPDATVAVWVLPAHLGDVSRPAYFCDSPNCRAVYFDDFERSVTVDQVRAPVWPKDSGAPICGCFGFTAAEIDEDLAEKSVRRVKTAVARAGGVGSDCLHKAADGRNCATAIQSYYFRHTR